MEFVRPNRNDIENYVFRSTCVPQNFSGPLGTIKIWDEETSGYSCQPCQHEKNNFYALSEGKSGLTPAPAPNPGDISPAKIRGLASQKTAGGAGAGPGAVDAGFLPGVFDMGFRR